MEEEKEEGEQPRPYSQPLRQIYARQSGSARLARALRTTPTPKQLASHRGCKLPWPRGVAFCTTWLLAGAAEWWRA